jgi:hypothetical protein
MTRSVSLTIGLRAGSAKQEAREPTIWCVVIVYLLRCSRRHCCWNSQCVKRLLGCCVSNVTTRCFQPSQKSIRRPFRSRQTNSHRLICQMEKCPTVADISSTQAARLLSHSQSSDTIYELSHYLAAVYHRHMWYWENPKRKVSIFLRRISTLWHADTIPNLWESSDASWIWKKKEIWMDERVEKGRGS